MKWPQVTLAEIATIKQGGRLGLSGNHFVDAGIPAYGAGGLNGYLDRSEYDRKAVILSAIGARCGKCFYVEGKWTSLANTTLLLPNEEVVDAKFLWYSVNGEEKWLRHGTGQPYIKPTTAKEKRISLPPLAEQRRIVAILDQADALRHLRRDSLARLAELANAIFETRYGHHKGEVSIENAVSDTLIGMVRNGASFGSDFPIPYVRMDAITTDGAFLPEKVQRTAASEAEVARYALETGDILFNTRNSRELVGKTAIYRGAGPCTFNNNIMRIRMKPDWDPVFVEAFFRSKAGRQELEKRKSGTTSVWAVYWSQLKTLKIPKPSREEQASFRAIVEAIWKKADLLREDRLKMEHLFAALQHRAFRGEL